MVREYIRKIRDVVGENKYLITTVGATLASYLITITTNHGELGELSHLFMGIASKEIGDTFYRYFPEKLRRAKIVYELTSIIGINLGFQVLKLQGVLLPGTNQQFELHKVAIGIASGSAVAAYERKNKK